MPGTSVATGSYTRATAARQGIHDLLKSHFRKGMAGRKRKNDVADCSIFRVDRKVAGSSPARDQDISLTPSMSSKPALKSSKKMDAYIYLRRRILQFNSSVYAHLLAQLFNCMYLRIVIPSLQKYNKKKELYLKKKQKNKKS